MTKEKVSHSFLDRLKYAIRFRKWGILVLAISGPIGVMIGSLMTKSDPFDIRAMTVAFLTMLLWGLGVSMAGNLDADE